MLLYNQKNKEISQYKKINDSEAIKIQDINNELTNRGVYVFLILLLFESN